MKFIFEHDDHAIPQAVLLEVGSIIQYLVTNGEISEGFFMRELKVSHDTPNSLWGPTMGDEPIHNMDTDVFFASRGGREWKDKLIWRTDRSSRIVQVIGFLYEDGGVTLYTIYGGPPAPQNEKDPSNQDPAASKEFWQDHALNQNKYAHRALSEQS